MGKRHGGHNFMPNLWVFPGGRVDPEDYPADAPDDVEAAVRVAAAREAEEEAGLLDSLGGTTGLALRDQEVARVAFLDLDHIAELAQVDDSFQEDDLHVRSPVQCVSVYGSSARKRARLIAVSSWRW